MRVKQGMRLHCNELSIACEKSDEIDGQYAQQLQKMRHPAAFLFSVLLTICPETCSARGPQYGIESGMCMCFAMRRSAHAECAHLAHALILVCLCKNVHGCSLLQQLPGARAAIQSLQSTQPGASALRQSLQSTQPGARAILEVSWI